MSVLQIILAAIIVLGPLVAIHEFGHFWVARRLGVRVLAFSIGFGPVLWRRKDATGTEFRLSAIPLGGYVKMLDEREGEVPPALLDQAFNRQSVAARMAIVAAGPLINLLFAVFLFWLIFLQGAEVLVPRVGAVLPATPAAQAGVRVGEEVVAVDGDATPDWEAVTYALADRMGESGELQLSLLPPGATQPRLVTVRLQNYLNSAEQDPLASLGLRTVAPTARTFLGEVVPGGPGAKAGLKAGDEVVAVAGQRLRNPRALIEAIESHAGKTLALTIRRGGTEQTLSVVPATERGKGKLQIGIEWRHLQWPAGSLRQRDYGVFEAGWAALQKTYTLSVMSLSAIGKMIAGLISVDNLSGPITIAKVAGASASLGWQALVGFMAFLSVSLGVLNLLPIPVLDGGHLLYYAIEGITGRPLAERWQMMGLRIGIALLASLMLLALFNDVSRLFR